MGFPIKSLILAVWSEDPGPWRGDETLVRRQAAVARLKVYPRLQCSIFCGCSCGCLVRAYSIQLKQELREVFGGVYWINVRDLFILLGYEILYILVKRILFAQSISIAKALLAPPVFERLFFQRVLCELWI